MSRFRWGSSSLRTRTLQITREEGYGHIDYHTQQWLWALVHAVLDGTKGYCTRVLNRVLVLLPIRTS